MTDGMIDAFLDQASGEGVRVFEVRRAPVTEERWGGYRMPLRSEARAVLEAALPLSPLSRRVEELEAEREQLRKIADSVLLARLASSYHVMNAALDRLADHLHPEIAEARALLKDGER